MSQNVLFVSRDCVAANRALLFTISAIVKVAHIISAPSKSLIVHRV